MSSGINFSKAQCPTSSEEISNMDKVPYASAVGSIMYAMICTRPDVSYALSVVSRYQSNPGDPHWQAVKTILKYLRRTKDQFLVYGGVDNELVVTGYIDTCLEITKWIRVLLERWRGYMEEFQTTDSC